MKLRGRRTVALLALVASAAACSSAPSAGRIVGSRTVVLDPLPNQVVFQVSGSGGGMSPPDTILGAQPGLTIFGNGDAYLPAKDFDYISFPGRPIELVKGHVPRAVLVTLVQSAGNSNVFDGSDLGMPDITDTGATTVTFRPTRTPARSASAYALDYVDGDDELTTPQRTGRQRLRELDKQLGAAVVLPDTPSTVWKPSRVEVTVGYGDQTGTDADAGTSSGVAGTWPGPPLTTLLTEQRLNRPCGVLTGGEAHRVFRAAQVHRSTRWHVGSTDRSLVVRALLPGEPGCAR